MAWWVNANGSHSVSYDTKAAAKKAAKSVWGARISREPLGGRHAEPMTQKPRKSLLQRLIG